MTKDTSGNAERDKLILDFLRRITEISGHQPLSMAMKSAEIVADNLIAERATK